MLSVRGDGGASVSGASTKLTVPSSRHEGGLLPRKDLCSGLGRCRSVMGGGFLFGDGHAMQHVGSSPSRTEPTPLALEVQSKPLDHQGSPRPGMGRNGGEAWVLECVCVCVCVCVCACAE